MRITPNLQPLTKAAKRTYAKCFGNNSAVFLKLLIIMTFILIG